MVACEWTDVHERRRVVLTGGPGAGKTALLELIRQSFCSHVKVLPEAVRAWERHPRRFIIESSAEFLDKASKALDVLRGELSERCQRHVVRSVRDRHKKQATAGAHE
jgi:adenylate kinase